jgi:hypothetical protein
VTFAGEVTEHRFAVGEATAVPQVSPAAIVLHEPYPNPFNPATRIAFTLGADREVELAVFDLRGVRVASLVAGRLSAGSHAVTWHGRATDGRELSSGVYLARLICGSATRARRLVLVR